jgi:predicted transposase YbfD/YdcC
MTRHSLALIDVFSEIPDFRQAKGKRHALKSILCLAAAAMLCGYRSYSAMAEWGRYYGQDLARALGFTHKKTPCASTLHNVFRNLDKEIFEARLADWAETILHLSADDLCPLEALAVDGKSLRGSQTQGAPGAHLLSAVSHRLGLTVGQKPVPPSTSEISVAAHLLGELILEGRVITADALLTQRKLAEAILLREADYLMVVKDNQAELLGWAKSLLEEPIWLRDRPSEVQTLELGHGRIEHRHLLATGVEAGDEIWPGLKQVIKVERTILHKKSGKGSKEQVYGVTSLEQGRAEAGALLRMMRQHWTIENKSHWVRDVTYDEDRSQVRSGSIPQVMAALRNTVIGLMRYAGERNIAAACRRFAAQPWSALALIGINPEN